MSAFIVKEDYSEFIQDNILDDITEVTDTLLDKAETKAVALMKGYLNARYDVANIFNKTGDDRNPAVLLHAINIALYLLHRRVPSKTPKHREEAYKEAIEWLKDVNRGEINQPDLPVLDDGVKDYILFGSNPKRTNHI